MCEILCFFCYVTANTEIYTCWHTLSLHDALPISGARGRAEFELHGLAVPGWLHPFDLVQLLHPALHLRCMRGPRLEALDELDLLGQHRLDRKGTRLNSSH